MERKSFSILVNAPRKKVWDVLWNSQSYSKWTAAFMEGSTVEADEASGGQLWKTGSKIRFIGPGREGMVSSIQENVSEELMSFKHLGVVKKGIDDYDSNESKEWQGAMENYTLKTIEGNTKLTVDMDISSAYLDYFTKAWPEALRKVKELAEI